MNSGRSVQDDSVHLSLNGAEPTTAARMTIHGQSGYHWSGRRIEGDRALLAVDPAAEHKLTLWMREDGTRVDRLLLTRDAAYRPPHIRPYPPESQQHYTFAYTVDAAVFATVADITGYTAHLADDRPLPDWLQFDTATGHFSGAPHCR